MTTLETLTRPATDGPVRRQRPFWRRKIFVFGIVAFLAIGVIIAATASKTAPKPVTPVAAPVLSAHGTIEPVAQATIATLSGGVVRSLAVQVGQEVGAQQQVAQISTPAQTEILVAPWAGTIMGLSVRRGDTVMPGTTVATIGDLGRYQVRTTDVDEYLIGQIERGQQVNMTVEALDGRKLDGTVENVGLVQQQASNGGVSNYPVVIQLSSNDSGLRPGMTVRIVFLSSGQ